jgi:ribonuclease Z
VLRVTFLGTSAAAPTLHRGLSAVALRRAGELLLFDCGEGTQRQMIRYGTGFDVAAIFFTHFHADHYLGAIGFLRTLSMLGRAEPLRL